MFHSSSSSSSSSSGGGGGGGGGGLMMDRRWKTNIETAPNCPRCASTNTKFCYYNNYSLSQPRYFCKSCRRYWTKGGSLRNVPFGGGCRKSRRSSNTKSAIKSSSSYQQYYQNSSNDSSPIGRIAGNDDGLVSTTTTFDDHDHIDLAAVFSKFFTQDSFNHSNDAIVPDFRSGQVQYPGEVTTSSPNLILDAEQEQQFYSIFQEADQVDGMKGVADYLDQEVQVLGADDHLMIGNYGSHQDPLSNAFDHDRQDFSWSDSTAASLSSFSELLNNNPGMSFEPATVVVNSDDHSMFLPTPPLLQGSWTSFDNIPSYGASIIN